MKGEQLDVVEVFYEIFLINAWNHCSPGIPMSDFYGSSNNESSSFELRGLEIQSLEFSLFSLRISNVLKHSLDHYKEQVLWN